MTVSAQKQTTYAATLAAIAAIVLILMITTLTTATEKELPEPYGREFKRVEATSHEAERTAPAWTDLAIIKHKAGDAAGARHLYRQALQVDPGYKPAQELLAMTEPPGTNGPD